MRILYHEIKQSQKEIRQTKPRRFLLGCLELPELEQEVDAHADQNDDASDGGEPDQTDQKLDQREAGTAEVTHCGSFLPKLYGVVAGFKFYF
jgi:hypothetical protein